MKLKSDKLPEVADDMLGREKLAVEIANGIIMYSKKQKDGITLSITGQWGSGKSTLISYISKHISSSEGDNYKFINFNPWMFFKNEGIKQAFLIEFALALNDFETGRTNLSNHMKDFMGAFKWVKYFNSTAGNVQEGLEDFFGSMGKTDSISDIKNEIEKILRKSKKKVLVFIDDIDRLLPEQVMELFQTISLVTNFSNVIYILAFDREVVIDSINKCFTGKGQDYLEKVIQIDYELPKLATLKLQSIFHSYLKEFSKGNKINFDDYAIKSLWELHGLKDYFNSIRDFKRFFNSLSFRMPSIADDINVTDFLAIEAIRIFDYDSYEKFFTFYSLNYRKRELTSALLSEAQFDIFGTTATDLLKAIMPDSILNGYRKDANSKRLHDPSYFERYFSLLTNDIDISEKDLRDLINNAHLRKGILDEAGRYGRVKNLVTRLGDRDIYKHYSNYDYSLIRDLIAFFNSYPQIFEENNVKVSNMIINLICCSPNKGDLIRIFFESFEDVNQNTQYNLIQIYFFHYIRMFVRENRSFQNHHQYFEQYYRKHYKTLEKKYLPVFRATLPQILFKSSTLESPFVKYIYQLNFAQLFPEEYPSVLESFLKDKDYVFVMAKQLLYIDETTMHLGRYNLESKDTIFPGDWFEKFYTVLAEMEEHTLNEKHKAYRKYILALDISNFPEIKFPSDRNPIEELEL